MEIQSDVGAEKRGADSGAAPCSADNVPTIEDFRTAARVNRWVARLLDECRENDPLWKRIFMEYPVKDLRTHAGRFEDMADKLEACPPNHQTHRSAPGGEVERKGDS